ncbi:fatty acid desaturase [Leptolyngbya sp. CCNP1308]|uniref:fatty acid desaturase n=1 Tax=Leptolyngbya sp. CCNP1308 TaxID=3110255 RepID=UPI002B1E9336|nr:fatty acid desaturase [Leptolyngbya sp. CCNP1308]MEA5452363.1 fatty acid desaturase [Leptolyngbya sp. CCNP1308]
MVRSFLNPPTVERFSRLNARYVLLKSVGCLDRPFSLTGIFVALAIVALWLGSLAGLLLVDIGQVKPLWMLVAVLGRTYIQTGLFIVAHDAIHGVVMPGDRRLNHAIGRLAVTLYAPLSYQKLAVNHWQHHRYPGQARDPDFHDGIHRSIALWYWKFMAGYLKGRDQAVLVLKLVVIVLIFTVGFQISASNLGLFWLLPIVLSSMQLFLFGTYLPHRSERSANAHCAISSNYPRLLSLLTCYYFGYHWEHHEYPHLPWYRLPSARQRNS